MPSRHPSPPAARPRVLPNLSVQTRAVSRFWPGNRSMPTSVPAKILYTKRYFSDSVQPAITIQLVVRATPRRDRTTQHPLRTL
jgi:hypothetical protein